MKKLFTYAVLWLSAMPAFSQTAAEKINSFLQVYANYGKLSGNVLVADSAGIITQQSYGYANIEWKIKNSSQTRFKIASISKQFTAVLIMQQVEEGKISLQDKISKYIPEYPKDKGEKLTIHHLLSHTGGLVHYFPEFYSKHSKNTYTPNELISVFWNMDLLFEPSTQFRYSSAGYMILGVILERVTGKPYETLLQERILKPLKMNNTGVYDEFQLLANKASGYLASGNLVNCAYRNMSTAFATGQLYSTAEDLYLWHKALNTNMLLSEKSKKLLFAPNIDGYGYGFMTGKQVLSSSKQVSAVWHTGGINGFNTILLREMEKQYCIVILGNAEPTEVENISKGILQILYGLPYELPKKSIAQTISKTIDPQGIEAGLQQYLALKAQSPQEYDFSEGALIYLSDYYKTLRKSATALRLLEFNIQEYPQSSWSYSNLATTYAELGNEQMATRYYEKTLALYPNDVAAKEYLKRVKKGN
jgi:CubicO group peptidase (beta-lactamase class C family)